MNIKELFKNEVSDEKMQWVYDLILEAYNSGEGEVVLAEGKLTDKQFFHLKKELGYTMEFDEYCETDTISGWNV